MRTVSIETMSPKDILVKEAFKRAIPAASLNQSGIVGSTGNALSYYDHAKSSMEYELLTQADFLREFDVNAHKINSIKYYPNPLSKDKEGKIYAKIKSRIAIGYQKRIHTKRLTALIGNNTNLRIISAMPTAEDEKSLKLFREGWEDKNIEIAIAQAISADGKVGDVAINFFTNNNKMGWRVFEFEKGDTLYPHYDPMTGELALFGRRYAVKDETGDDTTEYIDVWDNTHYMRYRQDKKGIKGATNKAKEFFGFDGWVIDLSPVPHGFPSIPIAYDRYGEPFWANSQNLIEGQEMSLSQFAENNAAYALRILYSFGEDMEMTATLDGTPKQITSSDPNAKVGFLEPADASNAFKLQMETIEKDIMRGSFAVETPEIKSGSDMSSLTVKMLFADAYLKAQEDAVHFQPFLDKIVECFKHAYGVESKMASLFSTIKVKAELFPYIFQSDAEIINGIVQLKGVGALSRRSSAEMAYQYGYGVVGENDRIDQEENEAAAAYQITNTPSRTANIINQLRNE